MRHPETSFQREEAVTDNDTQARKLVAVVGDQPDGYLHEHEENARTRTCSW